jgi:hypothetical protein
MCFGRAAILAAALLLSAAPVMAKPYVLNCTTSAGEPAGDLTVDLDQMIMMWGMAVPNYIITKITDHITKITDHYITAVPNEKVFSSDVGGELWVLDRVTGNYRRSNVGLFCKDNSCKGGNIVLNAFTYSGKCIHPMF